MREELLNESEPEADLLSPSETETDTELLAEPGLRPRTLAEFVGQTELKSHLRVILGAASKRRDAVDHLLFAGPPGLGKTTLAHIIATEMGSHLLVTSGPALERSGDLASILSKLEDGDVLFIDEIHRLPRPVEEVLYPAMEDFRIDIVLGKGPAARSIPLELTPFTLVGATTRTGLITGPLRDRFGLVARLDFYDVDDLQSITLRTAGILGVDVTDTGAWEIARRARGTPASPTGCCVKCAITQKLNVMDTSTQISQPMVCSSSVLTNSVLTKPVERCSMPYVGVSEAGQWACPRSP